MDAIINFITWLFNTRQGVLCLVAGGVVAFVIIAFVLERRTKRRYFNHRKSPDDFDLFDDDSENGWSDFSDDNN